MNRVSLQPIHKSLASLTFIGLLVICAITVVAQSGRRARKPATVPAPTPEASPSPTAAKSPEKSALLVFVGIEGRDAFTNIPLYFYDAVLKSCAERLDDRSSIKVEVSSRDVNRGEAVKRAKSMQEGYVVLLRLQGDRGSSNQDLSRLYVEYFVLAADSARQVTSGSVYQQAAGFKDIIVGRSGRGTIAQIEYRLKQAAGEAADRILASLTTHQGHDTQPVTPAFSVAPNMHFRRRFARLQHRAGQSPHHTSHRLLAVSLSAWALIHRFRL
jgi:hypothetical protein